MKRAHANPYPPPPPRALPFKRHPNCYMPSIHVVEVMCVGCEMAIAHDMQMKDWPPKQKQPTRPEPYTLAPSGMCGPVMGRRR